MKKILKTIVVLILIYSIFIKSFTSVFDFLNKNRDMGFWVSFFESDFPNIVGILSMIYLVRIFLKTEKRQKVE